MTTPAITVVGLCDGGLTGVGADVAFNDRLGKGNWADLGKKIIVKDKERNNVVGAAKITR